MRRSQLHRDDGSGARLEEPGSTGGEVRQNFSFTFFFFFLRGEGGRGVWGAPHTKTDGSGVEVLTRDARGRPRGIVILCIGDGENDVSLSLRAFVTLSRGASSKTTARADDEARRGRRRRRRRSRTNDSRSAYSRVGVTTSSRSPTASSTIHASTPPPLL